MIELLQGFMRSLSRFSRSFWSANVSELFERIAFYGMTPVLVPYLTGSRGFDDAQAIRLSGNFGLVVYGLPVLSGFLADLMGYRRAMMLAYALLTLGYLLVGNAASYWPIAGSLLLVALGASLIKPTITGTVQKTCAEAQRPVGFSIYYTLVNIGGFIGPNLSGQASNLLGTRSVFWVSAGSVVVALVVVLALFREPPSQEEVERKSVTQFLRQFLHVWASPRLVFLFLFVAGFWSLFFQFFGAFTLYLRNDLGLSQGNINLVISLDALAVIAFQVIVGYLTRNVTTSRAIFAAALVSSAGIALIGLHRSLPFAAAGVLVFAVGEMIYSAHFYHYLGDIAPPGQVGLYMGFAFLPIALGSFLAGQIGGPISSYFRDVLHWPEGMWFAFAAVGFVSAAGLAVLTYLFKPKTRG